MRYWVYINGQVLERPFEQEELSSIQGFTGETLICPEVVPAGAAQEWVAANLVFPPVQEQPLFAMPQPQALPPYYQYPQQTVPPYQTTRMPLYAPQPQPAYNPYPAAAQTQYQQPVYEQPYNPAEQTQNFDEQDMFDAPAPAAQNASPAPVSTEEELLQKIDVLTKEIQDVKQKLYSLSDNLQYSGVKPHGASAPAHYAGKEPASQSEAEENPSNEEDEAALPPGYIDDIPEVIQEDTETSPADLPSQEQPVESEISEIQDSQDSGGVKDMDSLLGGVAAVSPSEDFLQDAINTTFSNKHKKEPITDPNAIVDLAKKENTDPQIQEQVGEVVSDGNALSEDDIPTVEEDFDAKLSFTQANLERPAHSEEEDEEQQPLPEDIPQEDLTNRATAGEVREITEELLNEPAESQNLAEEGEYPVVQQAEEEAPAEAQPFEIEPANEAKDNTQTATLEEVFDGQPAPQEEEVPAQEEAPVEEQPLEAEPLPEDIPQEETDGIPQEVPSAQDIGETQDDVSFRENEAQQKEAQEVPAQEEAPVEEQPLEELPAEEEAVAEEEQPQEQPQEEEVLPPTDEPEEDPMNIETSESQQENEVLQEFAKDKKQIEENTKDMTSSAFDVVASEPQEGSSALDELTNSGKPAIGPMPAEGEDQFLKTFTSSIEEVFLDQPTSIISDYVPPAQASAEIEDADAIDAIAGSQQDAPQPNASIMDLKSATPEENPEGLKKVRRIKPAAIKTVPMVAANGGDITQGGGQPDIEEAIAELGGNSILEKALKTFGTISGLLVILLLFIALLAVMHIIPVKLSPAHYLLSKVFKKPASEATVGNNAVDASVAEALKEREAKLAAAQEIITKVKNYKLADGTTLEQKIVSIHPKDAAQIEWTADQAVDPSYYSIAAKLPPNQEGYNLTYRFSYNTMDYALVPTTSEANNIMQAAALSVAQQMPQVQPQAPAPVAPPVNQIPSVRQFGTGQR